MFNNLDYNRGIIEAIRHNNIDKVRLLIESGLDLDRRDIVGDRPYL
jgi:ankyrin repeat protein